MLNICLRRGKRRQVAKVRLLGVRLLVAVGLERRELAVELANAMTPACGLPERKAAGRFHLAHAGALCLVGDVQEQRKLCEGIGVRWSNSRG